MHAGTKNQNMDLAETKCYKMRTSIIGCDIGYGTETRKGIDKFCITDNGRL